MVKSVSMRDVGAWFEVASGRNRPRGSAGRGKMPVCRSSHENVIFAKTNPSRSNPVTQHHTAVCDDFPRRTQCRRKQKEPWPADHADRRRWEARIQIHYLRPSAGNSGFPIPDLVPALLLRVSASLRGKPDSTENREEPANSIQTPVHKQFTYQKAALPVRANQGWSRLVKPNQGIFHYEHIRRKGSFAGH